MHRRPCFATVVAALTLCCHTLRQQAALSNSNVLDVKFPLTPTNSSAMHSAQLPLQIIVSTEQLFRIRLLGLNKPFISGLGNALAGGSERIEPDDEFSHTASVVGYPDLPRWIFLKAFKNDLLLYGCQPQPGPLDIQIISTSEATFEAQARQLRLQVEPKNVRAFFEVEVKVINFNVEDVYEMEILSRLEAVIRALWTTSNTVFASKLASVLDVGGRRPLDPRHKDGFVVRIAGTGDFSPELRSLELEVRQLRNRIPCPRDYKRTSVEWRFRQVGLVLDWCGFRLIDHRDLARLSEERESSLFERERAGQSSFSGDQNWVQYPSSAVAAAALPVDPADVTTGRSTVDDTVRQRLYSVLPAFQAPSMHDLPRRSSTEDVMISIAVPMALCAILLGGLSGTAFCLLVGDDERSAAAPSLQCGTLITTYDIVSDHKNQRLRELNSRDKAFVNGHDGSAFYSSAG